MQSRLTYERRADQAKYFIQELQRFHSFVPSSSAITTPVKVAILDTGLQLCARTWKLYKSTPLQVRSWLGHENVSNTLQQVEDTDGHGTQCATALMQCIHKTCELFVGQIFKSGQPEANSHLNDRGTAARISQVCSICRRIKVAITDVLAQAIRHAVEVWNVDIISMSFGFEGVVDEIDEALNFATSHNVLLIAAASNVGGNTARARRWPGTRDNVLSMCATEGNGCEYKGNPPPKDNDFNFATLGVMVPVWTVPVGQGNSQQIYRSGTSIATPVAASIAASIIELIRRTEEEYVNQHSEHERNDVKDRVKRAKVAISQARGMCKVFLLMAQKTGRYHYVQPTNLLTKYMTPTKLLDRILDSLDE
jgi:hypothetical protein